ncbi:hypothetical protein AYI68_g2148 [Smittium mucronatum]|uniref:Uncharacterized protein n=1 Tax=Smittium mucronatum TaxID=133383 RepID=A0A1R0H3L2_9FUNG|nr:hypothetical protein AYI68_g2148 [Smittium mucronatum]
MSERIDAGMSRLIVSFRCLSHREQFNKMWSTVSGTPILRRTVRKVPTPFYRCLGGQVIGHGTAAEDSSSFLFHRFFGQPSAGGF